MGQRETLVERESELERVDELLDRAAAGQGASIVVEGSAGIGKTALLTAAAEAARRRGFIVAEARGGELERELPFVVARDLFRRAVAGATDRDELFTGAARFASAVTEPEPGRGVPEPSYVLEGMAQLAANLSERAPLLVAVDDLHWADPPSTHFVGYLASRLEDLRLALLVSTRPAHDEGLVRVLDALARERNAQVMRLSPLSRAATAEIVARRFAAPSPEFVATCHEASGGNPLYLAALLDAAFEQGLLAHAQDAARLVGLGSEAVGVSVRGRLAALSADARRLAAAAALLGPDAELRHVAALAELDLAAAAAGAAELERADLVSAGELVEFVHPVVRTTVYELRSPIERAAQHARAAQLLHASGAPSYRVGPHLLAAPRSSEPWAVRELRAAGRDALKRAAPDQAVSFLTRAFETSADHAARPALLRELAAAEWRAGREEAITHMRAAIAEEPLTGSEYVLVGWLLAANRFDEALHILDGLIADAPSEREQMRPLAHYVAIAQNAGAPDLAERARRLRALVEALGDDDGAAATVVGWLDVLAGDSTGAERLERVLGRALDSGVRVQQIELWIYAAWGLLAAERFDSVQRVSERAMAEARTRASAAMTAMAFNTHAQLAFRTGRLDDAEESARAALESVALGGPRVFGAGARMTQLECLAERGGAAPDGQDLAVQDDETDDRSFIAALELYGQGRLLVARGDPASGAPLLADAGRRLTGALATAPGYVPWRSELALALARTGERESAVALAAEELRLAGVAGTPRAYGMAMRAVGLLAAGDDSIAMLREATAALAGSGSPVEHARAMTDLGAAMRRRKMHLEAREVLRDALDVAHRCGARALASRATDELHAAGARPRTAALQGLDALTPSERRVARLAGAGRTNREIAQELFVTPKTVEKHLAGAYRKLGIASRGGLPSPDVG